MTGHPTGNVSKSWVAESGWKEGLTLATEDWANGTSGSERKRWTWTDYTQDNTSVAYQTNPRVVETKVGDSTNTKRTTVAYHLYPSSTVAKYGLVNTVNVYDANQSTILKTTEIEYNLDSAYTSKNIVGLPSEVEVSGYNQQTSTFEPVSRVTYAFDEGSFGDSSLSQNISPSVGHDNDNYGSAFVIGRGNLTSTKRWNVDLGHSSEFVTSSTLYNTAGAPVAQISPWDGTNTRMVRIGYADNFNSSPGVSTYAYPTVITDPAGNSLGASGHTSTIQYRYDIGANIEANSPAPAGNQYGKKSRRIFDSVGRLQRDSVWKYVLTQWQEHSYTRYEYPSNGIQSKVYRPIVDVNGNGNIAEDEVYSESWFDGAGRVRQSRTEHPNSIGGWSASMAEYDILGRVYRQSVPTEVNSSYAPAGDDAAGFRWTYQKYDWMNRVVRKINTDGADSSTYNASDVLISYEGCGCAGGLVTTIEGELVPRTDTAGNARRKQKAYSDILGRTWKTETYQWDGTTLYSSVVNTFNGRDQVVQSRQTDESSTANPKPYQDTTATFDGHGRLATGHAPRQSASTNTSISYYPDDSIHVQTDARGATRTMTYDSRGLVANVENAWTGAPSPTRKNFALSYNGATPSASSVHGSGLYPIAAAVNGDRNGHGWGSGAGGWNDNTNNSYPDWLQVDFGGGKVIDEIDVFTIQDNEQSPSVPTETMTFTEDGIIDFEVQYWDGSGWVTPSGGSVTGNNKVWKKFTFSPVTTEKIRVLVHWSMNSQYRYSRIAEVEAWGDDTPPPMNTETNYAYDDLGNRLTMTDDSGSTSYAYDQLSRLVGETRSFADSLPNAPLPNNSFELEYSYNLSGSLKSLTDPYGEVINYGYDKTGRLGSVTGSAYAGLSSYATGAGYTAWGGLKTLSYGNGVDMNSTFNSRLLPDHYELAKGTTGIMNKDYEYLSDGRLKFVEDQLDGVFDRLNIYDHLGRIKEGKTGLEASGGTVTTNQNTTLPYRQSYQYNGFGNMTQRNNLHWGTDNWQGTSNNLSYTYQNDRIANQGWTHDADGRVLSSSEASEDSQSAYDARGLLMTHATSRPVWNTWDQTVISRFYSGDGREVKRLKRTFTEDLNQTTPPYGSWSNHDPVYYIRSSVLGGQVVSETTGTGAKLKTFVLAAGAKIATQSEYIYNGNANESVSFDHFDASGMSYRSTMTNGFALAGDGQYDGAPAEMDPLGGNARGDPPRAAAAGRDLPLFPARR